MGAKHGQAVAETTVAPSSSSPATTPVPAPVASTVASPTAPVDDEDEPIAAPTSYRASLKARPAWAGEAFAPQPSDPLEVFVRSKAIAGKLDRDFIICRFQSFNHHDTFAGDDLHVRAKFGSLPEDVVANGPEDANLGFVSAPLVTLGPKDKMKFEVYDRDVFGMEVITKPTLPFEAPFNHVDESAGIECRTLTGAAMTDAVRTYGGKADRAIAKLAKDHVDPYSPEWTADTYGQAAAQRTTEDVAALLGWADARTQKRLAAYDAAMAKLDSQRAQVFATLHDAARDRVTFDRFHVKLGRVDCEGDTCTIHLLITNHDKRDALHFGAFLSPYAYVADAHSKPVHANGGGDIAPGATQEIALTSEGPHLTSGPSIVGICQGSRCAPLRVR